MSSFVIAGKACMSMRHQPICQGLLIIQKTFRFGRVEKNEGRK